MDLFETAERKYMVPRNDAIELIDIFNKIALDPCEEIDIPRQVLDFVPIRWDLRQVYLVIQSLVEKKLLTSLCCIIIDLNYKIVDVFLLRIENISKKKSGNQSNQLQFSIEYLKNEKKTLAFIDDLNEKIQKENPLSNSVLKFCKEQFSIDNIVPFIIPFNAKEIIQKLQLPRFNTDALTFISNFMELKTYVKDDPNSSKLKYCFTQMKQDNVLINSIRKVFNEWESVDLEKWAVIWAALLDGLMMNIIITSNERAIFAFKLIAEDGKVTINPIPMNILKSCLSEPLPALQLAERLSKRTGLRTGVFDEKEILKILEGFISGKNDLFDDLAKMTELIYSSPWYPDTLLNSFLNLFGFEIGSGMAQVHVALRAVVKYYKDVLIVTYQSPFEEDTSGTLVHLSYNNHKYQLKLIDTRQYHKIFKNKKEDPIGTLKNLKNAIENVMKIKFNVCFGFDIDILSDSISAKNMQALLGVRKMTTQLPFLASIGGLFAGLKALGIENQILPEDKPLVQLLDQKNKIEENPEITEERMKFVNYFEEFLKKGILCIVEESVNNIQKIRSPIYSKEGYLGLDIELLKQIISSQKEE